jgi:hypothetical protein
MACAQVAKKPNRKACYVNRPADAFGICNSISHLGDVGAKWREKYAVSVAIGDLLFHGGLRGVAEDGCWRSLAVQNRTRDWSGALKMDTATCENHTFRLVSKLLLRQAGETARSAQHAASNFNNRHVEIVCAGADSVNITIF